MIAEKITVTNTLTPLSTLICTARDVLSVNNKAMKIKLRCSQDETATVKIAENDTNTPVVILDPVNGIYHEEIQLSDISQIGLVTSAGTVDVEVIVEQPRI
jgi:hypothetical protein